MIVIFDSIKLLCLGGLKTQKILNTKNDWKRKYEGRNHKKEFNK